MITESLPARSREKIIRSIEEVYKKHNKMLYQVGFSYMRNAADAEDIVADVFVKLIKTGIEFENEEHEKAWLLRTAINLCKNNLKHWRRKNADIDEHENLQTEEQFTMDEMSETLRAVIELPKRYKSVIYLYYYEGYSTAEISKILRKPQSSVRVHLHEARKLLKGVLENEE